MAVPYEMLLHPELLSNGQLIYIIQERQLRIPNLERMPRDDLLELFHHYCVPYGQRKYRDSGRGKILNKTRHMSPEPPKNLNIMSKNTNVKLFRINHERLKPPPDLLSGHMKRIKIETVQTPININQKDYYNTKRKMSVDMAIATDSPPPKKEKKLITWP